MEKALNGKIAALDFITKRVLFTPNVIYQCYAEQNGTSNRQI